MKMTKDFDCVKMMRDIRDKVNTEIVKMDSAQIVEYFRKKSEEYESKYGQPLTKVHAPSGFQTTREVHF